jgi:hypothetical protein
VQHRGDQPGKCPACKELFLDDVSFQLRIIGISLAGGPEEASEALNEHYAEEHHGSISLR